MASPPPPSQSSYYRAFFLLATGLFGVWILDVLTGSIAIPLPEALTILMGKGTNAIHRAIILEIRLPRSFAAILAGMALGIAGLQMQTLFRNPLAGPSVLGITAGASLGVALLTLGISTSQTWIDLSSLGVAQYSLRLIFAAIGAAAVMLLILLLTFRIRDNVVILIVGIMVGNISLAIVSIWQYFSAPELIRTYLLWTFGNLGGLGYEQLGLLGTMLLLGLLLALSQAKSLNLLSLGERYAQSLGISILRVRVLIIFSASLLTGAVTAFCGPIAFIGLAVPHLFRALVPSADHRILIPGIALTGALVLTACDWLAQLPGSAQALPLNAITALIGSPVIIWVVLASQNLKAPFQ